MTLQQKQKARLQFLTWLSNRFPELYNAAVAEADVAEMREGLNGLGAETSWWQKLASGAAALGTTYLALRNQRDAMKLNLQRAEEGLPPVDIGATAPVIRTEIDLPPDVVQKVTQSAGTQINKVLLWGGVALVGVLLFMQFGRK